MLFRRRRPDGRRRRIRKLRLFAALLVLGVLGSAAFTLGLVSAIASEIPQLDPARQADRELNGFIYANDGTSVLAPDDSRNVWKANYGFTLGLAYQLFR